jgi:hypothetical protein
VGFRICRATPPVHRYTALIVCSFFLFSFSHSFSLLTHALSYSLSLFTHALVLTHTHTHTTGARCSPGVVSDKVFNGNRVPPMVLSGLLCSASLLALSQATTADPVVVYACVACVGAFAFAPHMLFGLAAREVVPSNVASTAGGFVKAIGQLGGAVAGAPFGALLQGPGWWAGHALLVASGVASAVSVMPLLRQGSKKTS